MAAASSAVAPSPQEVPPGPIYVDTQHEDLVHDAQLDYYGCKLATSSSGKTPETLLVDSFQESFSDFLFFYVTRSNSQDI
jgi:hypothetical protein